VQAGELQDERVALADVAPALARSLGMGGSVDELFARWPGAAPGGAPRARVREAMALLDCGSGRVADVCRALQVSRQWLAREFERDVGVGPKVFARVSRVQRAVAAARRGESWSAIAYRLGYADQSHLAREVFALKGQRPTALSRSSRLVTRAPLALVAAD
jgi:AraC-like DNA-binding protein